MSVAELGKAECFPIGTPCEILDCGAEGALDARTTTLGAFTMMFCVLFLSLIYAGDAFEVYAALLGHIDQ